MRKLIALFISTILSACATPAQKFNHVAQKLGFDAQYVQTEQFRHVIYQSRQKNVGEILHVYLDGDGTPWERNRWISDDPTARNPLILRLMVQDETPSILLGRPCYYGLSHDSGCDNQYWTSHRYSKEVVQSMSYALNAWLKDNQFNRVVLIGYSGGGSLAVLIADKVQQITRIVTIAANLNVKSWSDFHGYPRLKNSLNPADKIELNPEIKQIHFAGEDDRIVPASIIKGYADQQKNATYHQLAGKDHTCCWEQEWANILAIIKQ